MQLGSRRFNIYANRMCRIVVDRNGVEYTTEYFAHMIEVSYTSVVQRLKENGYIPKGWGRSSKDNYDRIVIPWTDEVVALCKERKPRSRAAYSSSERTSGTRAEQQLCWSCRKYCGGCPWSAGFVLPEGVKAKPSVKFGHRSNGSRMETYYITECPLYEQDDPIEVYDTPNSDDKDRKKLLVAITKRAARDYAVAIASLRRESPEKQIEIERQVQYNEIRCDLSRRLRECEDFFNSEWFEEILEFLGIESFPPKKWISSIRSNPEQVLGAADDIDDECDDEQEDSEDE